MTSPEFTVTFAAGVGDVLNQADQMVKQARAWAASTAGECVLAGCEIGSTGSEVDHGLLDMELSLLRSLRLLIGLAAGFGRIHLLQDSEDCLVFHQPDIGLTGGMIFHQDKIAGVDVPIGTWTLHS